MKKALAALVLLGLIAALLYGTTFQVTEGSTAIVLRFGNPTRTIDEAGLQFKLPPPIDQVVHIDRRMHVLDPEPNEVLTSERKNLVVDAFLVWSVEDPLRFYTSVNDRSGAEARLTDVLAAVVGDVLNTFPFSAMVSIDEDDEGMVAITGAITQAAAVQASANFGVKIEAARIKRLNFPAQNRGAVFQRMTAERESIAGEIRSEGKEAYEKIKAGADREEARLLAEANRKATELRGSAEAAATRIYAEAYSKDRGLFELMSSLDALEGAMNEDTLLILPNDHELIEVLRSPGASPIPSTPSEGSGD